MKTDIDKIKDLLFGNEKKALDAITRRLETPESRTADVSDVLPESILRSHASGKRLVPALQEPVEQCLKNSIRRDPEDFADALFPVIGPAIRKSIAEALRSMVQSLNQGIENSLSVTTRYQAWRAGMPLGQFILQRSILYRVEHAYLIKRADGLLIEHLAHEDVVSLDSDAVSAMYTAIQDFIHDSFSQEGGDSLTTAVIGDLALWAVHGPSASLVCVIRGVAPSGLRTKLREILEQIHLRHGEALASFQGDGRILGLETEMQPCLSLKQLKDSAANDNARSKLPLPALIIFGGLLLLAAWFWFMHYSDAQRIEKFRLALDSIPGIVINEIGRDDGVVVVRGLRDPLSESPVDLAPGFLIDPTELRLDLAPYQSLESEIVERRARRILKPPSGVELNFDGSRLRLSGRAPLVWKQRAQTLGGALPGIDTVDASGMEMSDAEILSAVTADLQPPPGVTLDVRDGRLSATGAAPQAWMLEASRRLPTIAAVRSGDLLGVALEERMRLTDLLSAVDGTEVFFISNDILLAGQDTVLDRLALEVRQIAALAARLGAVPQIRIRGYTDGIGPLELNRVIEMARAERVAQWLIDAGVSPGLIETQMTGSGSVSTEPKPALRKAEITIGVMQGK